MKLSIFVLLFSTSTFAAKWTSVLAESKYAIYCTETESSEFYGRYTESELDHRIRELETRHERNPDVFEIPIYCYSEEILEEEL
jgi:hypothetical protein